MVKKINIKSYNVEVPTPEGKKTIPYDVVISIENVILANGPMTTQTLSMPQLLKAAKIMEKIKAQKEKGFALIEDADFNIIKEAFISFKGFGINEVELCKRIEQAEDVSVKEAKKKE